VPGTENGGIPGSLRTALAVGGNVFTTADAYGVDGGVAPAYVKIPGFNIGMNGFEFALPTQSTGTANNRGVAYGDVQVWVGQHIDPTIPENLAAFITPERQSGESGSGRGVIWTADVFVSGQRSIVRE
jgi:hypothetical protein